MGCAVFTRMRSMLVILTLFIFIYPVHVFGAELSAESQLQTANESVNNAILSAKTNDIAAAKIQYEAFKTQWSELEGGIKKKSLTSYKNIEDVMGQVEFAFLQSPVKVDLLLKSLNEQLNINEQFIEGKYAPDPVTKKSSAVDLAGVVSLLERANQDIKQGDIELAKAEIEHFRESWLDVEGMVLTQSAEAYKNTERDIVLTYAYLSSSPARADDASLTISSMLSELQPLAAKTSYNMLDATTILLREGLEALLVIVSLLAFLRKSGHEDKKKWVWAGVGSGIGVSVVIGIIVQVLFSAGAFGNNNFMITGFTGVFAAAMLLYMTYWLHSNSSIAQWNQYIRNKSTKAMAKGSLWSLAVLAFLDVFREGTEIVLFLIGMVSSISTADLLAGTGFAVVILLAVAYLMLKFGMKIPIRPFFLISSVLVFYLCFKFTGMGVNGLQLAGLIPATHIEGVKAVNSLAIYPTWEGILPQMFMCAAAIGIVIWNKLKDIRFQKKLNIETYLNSQGELH